MSYVDEWRRLSARIVGIAKAAELHAGTRAIVPTDSLGVAKDLGSHCRNIGISLVSYHEAFGASLPVDAANCLSNFLEDHRGQLTKKASDAREALAAVAFLAAFEFEMAFHLSAQQEELRARSERAFLHLQWLLAVDQTLREKWLTAFEHKGETKCEQLGAVHLLWHGICAFKVYTDQARTDLVFFEPLERIDKRSVEGLVLTEWKVTDLKSALKNYEAARSQARLYTQRPLSGSELAAYRYVIAVSVNELPLSCIPQDVLEAGITYRHINVAIEPRGPSAAARKQLKKQSSVG